MWNCCCEYKDQGIEDDCCPDWCENRRVKGRFGLAFVAETPCCCPEPIGWQVEFCDTPSKVEQRCKEMVQWANCPPLPRCEPCPPVEVMSPCFPPRCNPCCPISNPCPPRCPPRCCPCPCPRPASPRRKYCPKVECACCPPPKSRQKCCCSKSKPKCRCDTNDEDEDEEDDNESCCPCKKDDERGFKSKRRRDDQSDRERDRYRRSRDRDRDRDSDRSERDSDRGDRDREKDRSQDLSLKDSFYEDEVPVKESKPKPKEAESSVYRVNTPPPYRNSNQRAATPPRSSTGRNTPAQSKMNTQNLSTPSQANNTRSAYSQNIKSSNGTMRKPSNRSAPANDSNEELFVDFTKYYESSGENNSNQDTVKEKDITSNKNEEIISYIHYEPSINFQLQRDSRTRNNDSNNIHSLYERETKHDHSFGDLGLRKSFSSSYSTRKVSKSIESKTATINTSQLNQEEPCSTIISMKQSKQSQPLGTFTTVFSNKELSEFDEFIVKKRKWLPYEFIKNVRRKVVGFFKNINATDTENDTESHCSYIVYGDVCKKLMLINKDIEQN